MKLLLGPQQESSGHDGKGSGDTVLLGFDMLGEGVGLSYVLGVLSNTNSLSLTVWSCRNWRREGCRLLP